MFKVKTNEDFRTGYGLLSLLTDTAHAFENTEMLNANTIALKRELRKWSHRDTAVDVGLGFMVTRRLVKDNGIDGYVELVSIPDEFDTEESADEFFKDFLYIQYRYSPYDCTGQAFTGWYYLFKRNGKFYAYHSIHMDV